MSYWLGVPSRKMSHVPDGIRCVVEMSVGPRGRCRGPATAICGSFPQRGLARIARHIDPTDSSDPSRIRTIAGPGPSTWHVLHEPARRRSSHGSIAEVAGDLVIGLGGRAGPGRARSTRPWCGPGRCRRARRRRRGARPRRAGRRRCRRGRPRPRAAGRSPRRSASRSGPSQSPEPSWRERPACCTQGGPNSIAVEAARAAREQDSGPARGTAPASSPGITRRSISISHQSGTTLTLWPPSIRPTERLGGPRIGSGVDRGERRRRSRPRACDDAAHPVDRVDAQVRASSCGRRRPGSGSSSAPPPCGSGRGRAGSARRRSPGRPRGAVSASRDEPGVGELLVDRAGQDHRRRARRAARGTSRAKADEHRRHPPLDVARAPAVEPAPLDPRRERVDRHPVGRHGVLMDVEEDRPPRARAPRTGPAGCRGPARPAAAGTRRPGRGTSLRGSAVSRVSRSLGPGQRPPHRVDARDRDEVADRQARSASVHGAATPDARCSADVLT